jgi:hypothetical protein
MTIDGEAVLANSAIEHPVRCGPGYANKGAANCVPDVPAGASNPELLRALETVFSYFNFPDPGPNVRFEVQRTNNGFLVREPGTTGNAETIRYGVDPGRGPGLRYYNKYGQPLDPRTGKPPGNVSKQEPADLTHIRPAYRGPFKGLPGWYTGR